jgi:cobalt-zinc-cadmium efflux system membrane fusion protein
MISSARRFIALALVTALGAEAQTTVATFAVSDAELERLGVQLGSVQRAERVELATAPAEVVVPPARQALVSAPQGGVVARLLVASGETVTAEQVLAEIDSAEYLERQRDYLDAAAAAELAAAQEARDRGLFDDGIIANRRLAETAAAARAAQSRLDQARAQLELAGLTRAELARLREQRGLATRIVLRAPFDGTVIAVHAAVGGRVDTLDPVLAIADLAELWLEIMLPQESAARVTAGMGITAAAPGGLEVAGTVTTVGGVVEHSTQAVLVRAAFDNQSGTLRAGQFVTARIHARPTDGAALAVPASAVTREGGAAVLFVRAGEDVRVQRVDLLGEDGTLAYIADGVAAGARIAVAGVSALKALWLSAEEDGG